MQLHMQMQGGRRIGENYFIFFIIFEKYSHQRIKMKRPQRAFYKRHTRYGMGLGLAVKHVIIMA